MFKKNKNEHTFKYIDDEATVLYRALDKDGNVLCESMVLEDILEECESLKGYHPREARSLHRYGWFPAIQAEEEQEAFSVPHALWWWTSEYSSYRRIY